MKTILIIFSVAAFLSTVNAAESNKSEDLPELTYECMDKAVEVRLQRIARDKECDQHFDEEDEGMGGEKFQNCRKPFNEKLRPDVEFITNSCEPLADVLTDAQKDTIKLMIKERMMQQRAEW